MAKKDARLAKELRDNQLREVLSTPAGKALVWRLMTGVSGVFAQSFSSDLAIAGFNEGKRSVGLVLMREAQRVAPEAYLEMIRERITADLMALEPEKEDADADDEPPENKSSHA